MQCTDAGFEISRVPVGLKAHLGVFFRKIMLIDRFLAGIGRMWIWKFKTTNENFEI